MGVIVSSLVSTTTMCVGYCACASASQLCELCFGNANTTTSGRKRSVLLLVSNVALSLLLQYSWAPSVRDGNWITRLPLIGSRVRSSFDDGCVDHFHDPAEVTRCVGFAGVYRATFVTTVFFLFMSMATANDPAMNRKAWPAKYTMCLLCLAATFFVSNNPFFFGFYLWMARVGASLFLVVQQIILIDLAYSWNESWLQKSVDAELAEYGAGKKWLVAIVAAVVALFGACLLAFVFLYRNFAGCATNTVLVTLTLLLVAGATAAQLTGEEGNLLTSATVSAYAVYLVASAVSHNPNGDCNPFLEKDGKLSVAIGILITFVSLAWTVWSWTDDRVFTSNGMKANPEGNDEPSKPLDGLDIPFLEEQGNSVAGVVMEEENSVQTSSDWNDNELWKLNLVFALISTWVTVTLTGWGSVTSSGGTIDLWFIIISQWTAIGLYVWTLVAPRLFPDRDFS